MHALDGFLARLHALTQRLPEVEAHVLWHHDERWTDAIGDVLEAEEIPFYAEGLLTEGFHAIWQHLTSAEGDAHLRLLFWQNGAPVLPELPHGWALAAQVSHPA